MLNLHKKKYKNFGSEFITLKSLLCFNIKFDKIKTSQIYYTKVYIWNFSLFIFLLIIF